MMEWITAALAGAITGVLSGFGIGGGSLLLIYMTSFAGVEQNLAQGDVYKRQGQHCVVEADGQPAEQHWPSVRQDVQEDNP